MKLEIVFNSGREETLYNVTSFNVTEEQTTNGGCHAFDVAQTPSDGKLFEVNPLEIDRSKFENPIGNYEREWTRQIINEAFVEVDKHPERYSSAFYTLIPEKKWNDYRSIKEFKDYSNDLGGQMADWVEQALEWAQRICNGESWKTVCNDIDTVDYYRLVVWKNGKCRLVGGSRFYYPASNVCTESYCSDDMTNLAVPLVVIKKK